MICVDCEDYDCCEHASLKRTMCLIKRVNLDDDYIIIDDSDDVIERRWKELTELKEKLKSIGKWED